MNLPRSLFVLCLAACAGPSAFECGASGDYCSVEGGEYLAQVPKTWNGSDLLPTFVHYHGFGGTAQLLSDSGFHDPMMDENVLAIYPNSIDGRWGFRNGPSGDMRDELAFYDAIINDVRQRGMPIDEGRLVVSGFSIGASMAWEIGCARGDDLLAIAPVSGALWLPLPQECSNPPPKIRQEHGTADTVFPMEGRKLGDSWQQGPVQGSIDLFVEARGCSSTFQTEVIDDQECKVWVQCDGGGEARLCVHDGDHRVTNGWHARTSKWLFEQNE
ncbi:MAG: PHB depolymerase family esterase [Myxococcota bacterium]